MWAYSKLKKEKYTGNSWQFLSVAQMKRKKNKKNTDYEKDHEEYKWSLMIKK